MTSDGASLQEHDGGLAASPTGASSTRPLLPSSAGGQNERERGVRAVEREINLEGFSPAAR